MATKEQNEEKGLGGYYEPYTSNITIRSGLLPENYAGTYAHEAGHKIANQGLAIEGKSKASPEQSILIQDFMNPKVLTKKLIGAIKNRTMSPEAALDIYATQFATPLSGTVDPAKLVDKYYASHHRADAPSSWETQTLRNLESKGILTEPYTPEARPENIALTGFKKRYYELLKKKNK
jgi:hypothetical protein